MNKDNTKSIESFANGSIPKVIIKNCIPALIAMIMVMIYNLADTFFIGLTHNDLQVAAVSLATPVFMIFMSLGTLFGVGGTSVISRALGAGNKELAKKVSSFCMWACVAIGLVFMAILWIFMDPIAYGLGASESTIEYTRSYLVITVGCGVFSLISNCFSNIIRTEGEPMKAMTGTVAGNLLNIILDPIMILAFGWGIVGAAVATVIGNIVSALYYLLYFLRGKSDLSISPKYFSMKEGIFTGVISVGISSALANLLSSLSSIVINSQMSKYGDLYVAGYGVTSKVFMIVTLLGIGIGSGAQPFFGYCFGAKNKERLIGGIKFSTLFATAVCIVAAALCFIFAGPIVKIFLTDEAAYSSAISFTRILMCTAWLIGPFAICQTTLQGMGAATPSLLAVLIRQGIILIPAVFIMNSLVGMNGLIWAQPIADVLSLIIIIVMVIAKIKKLKN